MRLISREEFQHVFHRQRGILDQTSVSMLEPLIGGDDEGILSTLIHLKLMGASARILRDPNEDVDTGNLKALLPKSDGSWGEVVQALFRDTDNTPSFHRISSSSRAEIWAGSISFQRPDESPGLWLLYGNGRAVVGSREISEIGEFQSEPTFLDAATLVCGSSMLAHRYAMEQGVFLSQRISDCWVSMTARVEGLDPEDAIIAVRSRFGTGTASFTSDGTGSLVRFRVPIYETPESLLWQFDSDKVAPSKPLDSLLDIGPIPAKKEDGTCSFSGPKLPNRISDANALVLGAGGLGSWAIPLILRGCDPSDSSITIVDGDQRVESHNLNRQVLYQAEDIGRPKAYSARSRVLGRLGLEAGSVHAISSELQARHSYDKADFDDVEMTTIEEISGESNESQDEEDERIISALDSMQVALSCLDNQYARTTLNRACNDRGVTMVNGGCEGTVGLVETFSGGRCMVCSYGPEEAFSMEQISCQEEGSRPVNSIVTTSSYVGAMMAATALCELARQRGVDVIVPESRDIVDGTVSRRCSGALPWIEGSCDVHL